MTLSTSRIPLVREMLITAKQSYVNGLNEAAVVALESVKSAPNEREQEVLATFAKEAREKAAEVQREWEDLNRDPRESRSVN